MLHAEASTLEAPPVDQNTDQRRLPLWPGIGDVLEEFGGLPVPKRLKDALSERGISAAVEIQATVMPRVVAGDSVVIHAPTGGGKTLAYLLPLLARLQPTIHIGMQVLILVPTAELALQITRELRWLIEVLSGPERVCWFNPQVPRELACEVLLSRSGLWDAIRKDTAVLVSTPALILAEVVALRWESKKFNETLAYFAASNLNAIVFDEADVLFPALPRRRSWSDAKMGAAEKVTEHIIDVIRRRYRNRPLQFICASATANVAKVRNAMRRLLEKKWPKRRDVSRRQVPVLMQHGARVDPTLKRERDGSQSQLIIPQTIVHAAAILASDQEDRFSLERLRMTAAIVCKLEGTVLVFVPEKVKLDAAVAVLREAGVEDTFKLRSLVGLNEELDRSKKTDERLLDETTISKRREPPRRQDAGRAAFALQRSQELVETLAKGQRRVLVAKSDTGRGVDLEDVQYVVMVRLPSKATEYVHLAGRTGRMGRGGTVITLMSPAELDQVLPRVEGRLGIKFDDWDVEAGKAVPSTRKLLPPGEWTSSVMMDEEDEEPWQAEEDEGLQEQGREEAWGEAGEELEVLAEAVDDVEGREDVQAEAKDARRTSARSISLNRARGAWRRLVERREAEGRGRRA